METPTVPDNSERYRHAAIGFVIMNLIYLALAFWKVPAFNVTGETLISLAFFAVFIGVLARFIYLGSKKLVLLLAAVYAGRILFSSYTIIAGTAFPLVPYVLPTTMISFYLFGRVLWKWP